MIASLPTAHVVNMVLLFAVSFAWSSAVRSQPAPLECVSTTPPPEGNAPNDARILCDRPPPCGGLDSVRGVTIQNSGTRPIRVTVSVFFRDESNNSGYRAPIVRDLAPRQTSDLIACSGEVSYADINRPKSYIFQFRITHSNIQAGTITGQPNAACSAAPAVRVCAATSLQPGTYQFRSRATIADRRIVNGQQRRGNAPMCIDVANSGRYYQGYCHDSVTSQRFVLEPPDLHGCFPMRAVWQSFLVLPANVPESGTELLGWSDSQVTAGSCQRTIDSTHWNLRPRSDANGYFQVQNKATGFCIDADAGSGTNQFSGKIHTIGCRATDQSIWQPIPVTVAPSLTARQRAFLSNRLFEVPPVPREFPPNVPRPPAP